MSDHNKEHKQQLPIDADGVCMMCGEHPVEEDKLICTSCASPWHPYCVANPPETLSLVTTWECPDCSASFVSINLANVVASSSTNNDSIVAKMREIEVDETLTVQEKARKRQELMMAGYSKLLISTTGDDDDEVDDYFKCCCCMHLLVKPISMSCGHNACLKCFQSWVNKGNQTCMTCRSEIPKSMTSLPRINASLVEAIRLSRNSSLAKINATNQVYQSLDNENRPDTAFTTEKAQRRGRSNAASGKVFIRVPEDHFGPILPEHDPVRNRGVLVGDKWADRLDCRQWAVHRPHVAGIAGQSEYGAQSVVLSGGYEDDEDHGEWFLYTGSGGRDLRGNKRTSKFQAFDQRFTKYNAALSISCLKGYPVRVVRSSKEKRSSYGPEKDKEKNHGWYRYDGIYRIEKCWMKAGAQKFNVCRFLFVRCDNAPAPWSSDARGDRPRMLPEVIELAQAEKVIERLDEPSWDFDAGEGVWKWLRPPPPIIKSVKGTNNKRKRHQRTTGNQLRKDFICKLCNKFLSSPVIIPCAHVFCKPCLEGAFSGQSQVRERSGGGRSLRPKKNVFKCPTCSRDVSDFSNNLQVNRELESAIEDLKKKAQEREEICKQREEDSVPDKGSGMAEEGDYDIEDDYDEEDEGDENDEDSLEISSPKRQKVDPDQPGVPHPAVKVPRMVCRPKTDVGKQNVE